MTCLDDDVITELRDILGQDLLAVVGEFVEQFQENLESLRRSLGNGNFSEVTRLAHLLKGSAGNLGVSALAAQFLLLERAARSEDAELAARELSAAESLGESCIAELAEKGLLPAE